MKHQYQSWAATVLTAAGIGLALSLSPVVAVAGTIKVTPANMNGWQFNSRDATGQANPNPGSSGQLVTGPATPPDGVGSANLTAGNGTAGGDGAEELSTTLYDGTALSSITALSYYTYDVQNNGQQFPYLSLSISTTGTSTVADDVLFFEPPYQTPTSGNPSLPDQGATVMNTWQQWDAFAGGWWDNNGIGNPGTGVVSLATIEAAYPNATIALDGFTTPPTIGGIGLNVGFASPTDQFNGNVDALVVGLNGVNTTYDFEPAPPPPTNADQCKKGGWMQFSNPSFKNQGECVSFVEHQKQH